jgi:hypothetical protein
MLLTVPLISTPKISFKIHAGARVMLRVGSHVLCIGSGLIKFASEHVSARID